MATQDNNSTTANSIPAYAIHVNTTAFKYKNPFVKERAQEMHLPRYWHKVGMDQKRISPNREDRLSQLTTKQIDRIIDMEKIRTLLQDKKNNKKEIFLQYDQSNANIHPNVYQANFLASINAIAIKRNIRHQKSESYDQYFGQTIEKDSGQPISFKYKKLYKINDENYKRFKTYHAEDDDQKSINSIQDELQQFQEKIQKKKFGTLVDNSDRKPKQDYKVIEPKRWFNGMSSLFLKNKQINGLDQKTIFKSREFDISSQMRRVSSIQRDNYKHTPQKTGLSLSSNNRNPQYGQPLIKYRIKRLSTIK